MKVCVFSLNVLLSHVHSVFLDQVINFGEILGDQEKDRSPKKLKLFMDVPYVAHLKVQVLSFNMNLIATPQRIPRPSYSFGGRLGRSGKGSFTEKAKIVDRSSICGAPESTGSKLQYEQCLFSVGCL